MRARTRGFTLIETLIALAVIGIAFAALALSLVNNLRATTTARVATDAKAAANQVLERLLADVLVTGDTDSDGEVDYYAFEDYYWSCPDTAATSSPPSGVNTSMPCSGTDTASFPGMSVQHSIVAGYGIAGEGFITIAVTATDLNRGQILTIGDRVTCYDIYPSPDVTTPDPCPVPTAVGGGWL